MTRFLKTILFILLSLSTVESQISGQLFQYDFELPAPGIEVYLNESSNTVFSDFDGFFTLDVPENIVSSDLIIKALDLTIQIKNIDLNNLELNLGKILLPQIKSLGLDEFDSLSEAEKESCVPMYCWLELIGYYKTDELDKDYLKLNCTDKITDFVYDINSKTVKVDWSVVENCQ